MAKLEEGDTGYDTLLAAYIINGRPRYFRVLAQMWEQFYDGDAIFFVSVSRGQDTDPSDTSGRWDQHYGYRSDQ